MVWPDSSPAELKMRFKNTIYRLRRAAGKEAILFEDENIYRFNRALDYDEDSESFQREIELVGNLFGMPGRTEVDAAHRRIAELERQLRRLRDGIPAQGERTKPASVKPAKGPSAEPAAKQTAKAKPAAKKKTVAKKTKPLRAVAAPAVKRAQPPAITAIAMPEPLKSLLSKRKPAAKTAKRKR